MCLILRKHDKVRKAILPKLVWKVVHIANEDNWIGPFQRYTYHKFEECLKAKEITSSGTVPIKHLIITENFYGDKVIKYGFHASRSFYKAKSNVSVFAKYRNFEIGLNMITVPCIIPKGAEYCKGDYHEIVSTDIIVFKNFRDLIKNRIELLCTTSRDCL